MAGTSTIKNVEPAEKALRMATRCLHLILYHLFSPPPAGPPAGKLAKAGTKVLVHYTGRLKSNGKVFDKSSGKPFAFRLGQLLAFFRL